MNAASTAGRDAPCDWYAAYEAAELGPEQKTRGMTLPPLHPKYHHHAEPVPDEPLEVLLGAYEELVAEFGRVLAEHLDDAELARYFGPDPLGIGRLPPPVSVDLRAAVTFSWKATRRLDAERRASGRAVY